MYLGQKWKSRRRLLTPAFHFKILDDFIDVFNNQSRILCDLLEEQCQSDSKSSEVDIYPFLTRCTLDIICGEFNYLCHTNFETIQVYCSIISSFHFNNIF